MENPALLLGIPLLAIGALGLLIAFSMFAVPEQAAVAADAHDIYGNEPGPSEYVVIGLILGFVTAVEVALFYLDQLSHNTLVVLLIILSLLKFGLVIGWFMHLRFDNKLFTVLFIGGLLLAMAVFTVAVTTLHGNLV